jgi:hypothetical protein
MTLDGKQMTSSLWPLRVSNCRSLIARRPSRICTAGEGGMVAHENERATLGEGLSVGFRAQWCIFGSVGFGRSSLCVVRVGYCEIRDFASLFHEMLQ